ncbi:Transcription factor GTE1, partial [Mucuna pruriens]
MYPTFGFASPSPNDVTEEDLYRFRYSVHENFNKVLKLEEQVAEVEQFYRSINAQVNNAKDKGREKHVTGTKRTLQGASSREANHSNTTQEVMHQFSTILHQANELVFDDDVLTWRDVASATRASEPLKYTRRQTQMQRTVNIFYLITSIMMHFVSSQITQHRWAWPFMDPVDVEGLGLHDYYEIIEKPMDFSTIKKKMDAKDGSGYKNVREIYSDVRLIFKNAMKYNDEKHDIHVMAKTLLEKFEKKWLQLLPKVAQAENEQLKEEAHAQLETQLAQEATYAHMAKNISLEMVNVFDYMLFQLCDVEAHLKTLKEMVIQKCRKLSSPEKVELSKAFYGLNEDNLNKALQIISENDPTFQPSAQEVNLDLDDQNDFTLWKLNVFIRRALEEQERAAEDIGYNRNDNNAKRRR